MQKLAPLLKSLEHPHLKMIDLSLDRMQRFLALLGNPERQLPPVIHVAGTNGKGSLVAYLHAIFNAAGYTVHRYTSPHLVRFNERIVIADKEIDNDYLLELLQRVKALSAHCPVTFFEATTAAAYLAFAEHAADVVLLETGMGGRLDATNVIEKPLLTAITPVSIDHAEYLGDTIAKIATEKAGILKTGTPCIVGRQAQEALQTVETLAQAKSTPLIRYGKEWEVVSENGRHTLTLNGKRVSLPSPSLSGTHQYDNAATAVVCIKQLPIFSIDDNAIHSGITSAVWPARMQRLTKGELVNLLRKGDELWLDGGHNPAAGEAIARWVKNNKKQNVVMICGMIRLKDTQGFLEPVAPYLKRLHAITIPEEPLSKNATDVAESSRSLGIETEVSPDLSTAIGYSVGKESQPITFLIAGSLYLAGYVLRKNN